MITSSVHTDGGRARFHLDTLGGLGMYYRDKETLVKLLCSFDREAAKKVDWNAYRAFEPIRVMQTFKHVFLGARAPPQTRASCNAADTVD